MKMRLKIIAGDCHNSHKLSLFVISFILLLLKVFYLKSFDDFNEIPVSFSVIYSTKRLVKLKTSYSTLCLDMYIYHNRNVTYSNTGLTLDLCAFAPLTRL